MHDGATSQRVCGLKATPMCASLAGFCEHAVWRLGLPSSARPSPACLALSGMQANDQDVMADGGSFGRRLVVVGRRAVLDVYRRKSSSFSVSRWADTEGVFSNACSFDSSVLQTIKA
jgi:hypothetical protein